MSVHRCVLILAAFSAFAGAYCHAQQTMDNDAVIKLSKAGLSEDLIVQTITALPATMTPRRMD
jgi:hypothetical protein